MRADRLALVADGQHLHLAAVGEGLHGEFGAVQVLLHDQTRDVAQVVPADLPDLFDDGTELLRVIGLGHAEAGEAVGRLDHHRKREAGGVGPVVRGVEDDEVRYVQPRFGQPATHDPFVLYGPCRLAAETWQAECFGRVGDEGHRGVVQRRDAVEGSVLVAFPQDAQRLGRITFHVQREHLHHAGRQPVRGHGLVGARDQHDVDAGPVRAFEDPGQ